MGFQGYISVEITSKCRQWRKRAHIRVFNCVLMMRYEDDAEQGSEHYRQTVYDEVVCTLIEVQTGRVGENVRLGTGKNLCFWGCWDDTSM